MCFRLDKTKCQFPKDLRCVTSIWTSTKVHAATALFLTIICKILLLRPRFFSQRVSVVQTNHIEFPQEGNTYHNLSANNNPTAHLYVMPPKPAKYKTPFPFTGAPFEHEEMLYTLATKEDCLKFRNFADSDQGFELRFDDKNVLVWDKKVEGESMRIVKTFSIFEGTTPAQLWDLLQESVYRLTWDANCLKSRTVVRMDARNDICYYASKAPPGVSDRDVLCQRAWHSAGNGEYVIMNTSVKHKSCPEKMKYTRAWSLLSGYLIRPHGNNSCSLVFISQTDPKGLIPAKIINYVTQKFVPDTVMGLKKAAKGFPEFLAKQENFVRDWDIPEEGWGVPVPNITLDIAQERWFSGKAAAAPPAVEVELLSPTTAVEQRQPIGDDIDDDAPAPIEIDDDDL